MTTTLSAFIRRPTEATARSGESNHALPLYEGCDSILTSTRDQATGKPCANPFAGHSRGEAVSPPRGAMPFGKYYGVLTPQERYRALCSSYIRYTTSTHVSVYPNPCNLDFICASTIVYSAKQVFLTERFDEGLMVLRRILGWDMIDMTYTSMKVSEAGSYRWDGRPLVDRPPFDDLSEQAR